MTSLSATGMRRQFTLLLIDTSWGLNSATTGSPSSGRIVSLASVIGPALRGSRRRAARGARRGRGPRGRGVAAEAAEPPFDELVVGRSRFGTGWARSARDESLHGAPTARGAASTGTVH